MQPPPRTAPPGASGPPPTGGVPNAFRRTRPHKHPGSTMMMPGPAMPTMPIPPMTDPFAFGRQAMSTGSQPPPAKSSPLPMQAAPPVGFHPTAPGQEHGVAPQPAESAQGARHLPPPSSLSAPAPGVNVFTPNSAGASAAPPGQLPSPPTLTGAGAAGAEQGHGSSADNVPYITPGAYSSAPMQNRPPYGQEFRGDPAPYTPSAPGAVPSQPQTMPPPASQRMPDYGSRPPSDQNYFQPTSDPPQAFVAHPPAPAPTLAPAPAPSPHLPQPSPSPHLPASTPSPQLPHHVPSPHFPQPAPSPHTSPQMPPQSQVPSAVLGPSSPPTAALGPGAAEQQGPAGAAAASLYHNSHFQAQNYFSQNCVVPDPWFSQSSQEHFYHQMGGESGNRRPDPLNSQHGTPSSQGGPVPYMADPGTVTMFFKGNDVENEETLSGEGKAINGVAGATGHSFPNSSLPNHQVPPSQALPGAEAAQRGGPNVPGPCHAPPVGEGDAVYMNDSGFVSGTPKHAGVQFDHVENLECIPNQEVLPNEPQKLPTVPPSASENLGAAHSLPVTHGGDHFEGGPNLETPDSVPRPIRSESVSSSYSNVSHGSASGSRRPQGMGPTFIQQETARPPEDSSTEYFQQIDSSPAGEPVPQNMSSRMYHSQLSQTPTPSPPKPTGIFQASANSSFEPVRSHGVGVRPAEVDQARMVMEKSSYRLPEPGVADVSPGNLEQPPDNLENIFMPSAPQPSVGPAERRPSSRAHGARLKCESPATTLWAQNEMPNLGANILLAPAAPPVHAPVRQPSAEVIQPPEDGPLDLQAPQRPQKADNSSENLENPPKVTEADLKNPQATLPPSQAAKPGAPQGNTTGFYLQVTKDAQQGGRGEGEQQPAEPPSAAAASSQQPAPDSTQPPEAQPGLQGPGAAPSPSHNQGLPPNNQYPQPPAPGQGPPGPGAPRPALGCPSWAGRPAAPSSRGTPLSHPSQTRRGRRLRRGASKEYPNGRPPYPPQYYQDDAYRRYDARYGRYEGSNPGYREGEQRYREQPDRPSSRTSQYSDRPSSRQGYPEDYQRANRSAYDEYYAEHYKNQYDYGDRSRWERYDAAGYDPRYRGYYDQYWYNYGSEAYGNREAYYPPQQYAARPEDQWRYDPRYDASFDDEYQRKWSQYGDELDRRSVHSEQSAHSAHSSRSQQSQVYRSQPDLVSGGYEPPGQTSSLMVDYSYAPYSDNVDRNQTFTDYPYPGAYSSENAWPAVEQAPPRPMTPEKYSVPHRCARFGPGGQMVQVLPNLPSAGQPALVEIHSMETMLQDTQAQQELRSFPGPLVKEETHKVDVIKFAQNRALECLRSDSLIDKDSAFLIWEFIVLLCRQNGTVVGTDIADLLLREHRSVWLPGKSPNEANLIDFTNEPLERAEEEPGSGPLSLLSDTFMTVPENVGKETERFRELLLFGRKKDALESAMKNGLWGHALLLASKMDNRTHARVMTRFANSLPINDPLQTVYQLMSGRMPAAATCCGDEKWGDWRPHLAMVLSNLTHALDLDTRTIATMGDTLASKGLTDAAHFCYMMAQVGLGVYTKKSTKMVLIGANHSLPFFKFASNEAIQRTEAYEYAQSLGSQPCSLPNFQVFKFIYACRLAESGLSAQAFHYCEVIARALLSLPSYHSPVFVSQLIQVAAKLRFFDPQLKEKPEQELFIEPDWLVGLRQLDGQIKEGVISYSGDRATPQQYACSTPSSEFDQPSPPDPMGVPQDMGGPAPENPLMSSLMPNPGQPMAGVQLMPPAPPTILEEGMPSMPQVFPPTDGVPFYPVPPAQPGMGPFSQPFPESQPGGYPPPGQGYAPPYHPEQPEMYPGPPMPAQMSPQVSPTEPHPAPPEHQFPHPSSQPSSPARSTFPQQMDFYDQMAQMVSPREEVQNHLTVLSTHGSRHAIPHHLRILHSLHGTRAEEFSCEADLAPSPSIPEQAPHREEPKKQKKDSPKKGGGGGGGGGGGWLMNLFRKGKNEAHLPDDKNKSIVWDEKKQRWVNLDEPEEENKPPPPPPSNFPKMGPQMGPGGPGGPPSGGPPVNIFSRKAGTKGRYVDVLNPGGTGAKPASLVPAPADLFAPLAPMPMPANLFVPGAAPEEQQPMEGSVPETGGNPEQDHPVPSAAPQMFNPMLFPPGPEGAAAMDGEAQAQPPPQGAPPPQGGPPPGGVTFYNPSQFAQPSAPSGGGRLGRFGQRKYPALK
ncbi:hypothetical protein ANANG_G00262530 [Anguilla anguilla]|uniref:Protein transport protein sec16 n=1 Tax=Anguilla anguilla TaxID=7936 RepID=A0A9D3RL86_ANGAN|nr:hypothetical protein ANANG_G00262530 [Anguilla anguilla]